MISSPTLWVHTLRGSTIHLGPCECYALGRSCTAHVRSLWMCQTPQKLLLCNVSCSSACQISSHKAENLISHRQCLKEASKLAFDLSSSHKLSCEPDVVPPKERTVKVLCNFSSPQRSQLVHVARAESLLTSFE